MNSECNIYYIYKKLDDGNLYSTYFTDKLYDYILSKEITLHKHTDNMFASNPLKLHDTNLSYTIIKTTPDIFKTLDVNDIYDTEDTIKNILLQYDNHQDFLSDLTDRIKNMIPSPYYKTSRIQWFNQPYGRVNYKYSTPNMPMPSYNYNAKPSYTIKVSTNDGPIIEDID